ncbi:hypothetical protein HB780_01125 (plasmid) [Rhizobium lusitanum]|uniref:hypothetical protein n=1 Tax=Rhizobium lusitanum TaxID=293958 RepID=UPI00161375EB|nr:hypothetical protein [Rhizobium lusitanum]QND44436.1 hypothetical protein HB780_01125 [Rhizobium lusitanum]
MSEIALAEKSKCLAIVGLAAKKNIEVRTLEDLNRTDVRNFVIDSCDILLSETIDVMKGRLSDAAIGIGAVDIPNFIADDTTLNKVWGAAIAFGIYNNIFSPSVSGVTGLPYSLYRASNAAVEQMKRNNIKLSTPDTILKFHTDGLTAKDDIGVPKFIALYNIIINYQQPGRFHWVPFVKWKEFDKFAREVGIDVPYRIALTPAVITMPDGEEVVVNNRIIEVPIFFRVSCLGRLCSSMETYLGRPWVILLMTR